MTQDTRAQISDPRRTRDWEVERTTPQQRMLPWVDPMKAVALVWIFLNHIAEQIFGYPWIGNPSATWPPFEERLAQLRPLIGSGGWDVPINVLRYVGWFGDNGVQLFLIVSGFGLTWGVINRSRDAALPVRAFYSRRAARIFPLWWAAHFAFLGVWLVTGWGLSATEPATFLSLIGIRCTSSTLFYFAPAWWFVGLLIQLYLVYPLLWRALRQLGPSTFVVLGCATGFIARGAGFLVFDQYLHPWHYGAVFVTRLPEFVFGMSLAVWMQDAPAKTRQWLDGSPTALMGLASLALGGCLALTFWGMVVAPFLIGVGAFLLLFPVVNGVAASTARLGRPLAWVGRHSYSFYLLHHPLILILLPEGEHATAPRLFVTTSAAVLLTVAGGVALESIASGVVALLRRWRAKVGLPGAVARLGIVGLLIAVTLIALEWTVQRVQPQEVSGWGERPSLEPHDAFGWRLKPGRETRLRWESYDYVVKSNGLGFPGPEYPEEKPLRSLRILTTGDAFTSAEGVDTEEAWPRLLERELNGRRLGRPVEVLNFAITGYGPQQYAAVIEEYAPRYRPDLIVIGFFVNEYEEALRDNEEFRWTIGFGLPGAGSWHASVRMKHLRRFLRTRLVEPVREFVTGEPRPYGYFLGNIAALERDASDLTTTGRQVVADCLERIRTTADDVGAQVVIAMIPASVQVCGRGQLAYYPRCIDLSDSARFDLDQPQRMTRELADSLGIRYYDLRPTLRSVLDENPYQRHNMHWTGVGHRAVAAYLAGQLTDDGLLLGNVPSMPVMERGVSSSGRAGGIE